MKWKKLNGRETSVNIQKYRINWDKKSASNLQQKVKDFLAQYWKNQIVCEEFRIPSTKYRVDFVNFNKRIAVEVDGQQHGKFVPFFHGNRTHGFRKQILRDISKQEHLESNGIKVLTINHDEVDKISLDFFQKTFNINLI